jgi:multiple sugar transport system permease protein
MILFIALPMISAFVQSLFIQHEQVLIVSQNCGPFGCSEVTSIDFEKTIKLRQDAPLGKYNGINTYLNRSHLAFAEVGNAWSASETLVDFFNEVFNLPLYGALAFTLTYTAVVTPIVLILGFAIAIGVNGLPNIMKGPSIFVSLLPFLVTPLVGSLILFWMVDGDGIIGATIKLIFNDPDLSLKASTALTWTMLIVYGIWHTLPFSFIVFYAGLQTVPFETLEAALIDGATKWQRTIYVVIPHLVPLISFVTLMLLMDNFRVFEPIVSFSAEAHARSLSWIIYNDLRESGNPLYGSAGATSILTIIGIAFLLLPVLIRTWQDFKLKGH